MKKEYFKFIHWDGEHAIFKKANIGDIIMYGMGISHICHALDIEEGKIVLIKIPKLLLEKCQYNGKVR